MGHVSAAAGSRDVPSRSRAQENSNIFAELVSAVQLQVNVIGVFQHYWSVGAPPPQPTPLRCELVSQILQASPAAEVLTLHVIAPSIQHTMCRPLATRALVLYFKHLYK